MKTSYILIGLALLALGIYIGSEIAKANARIAALSMHADNVDSRLAALEQANSEHNARWRFLNRVDDFGRKLLHWVA